MLRGNVQICGHTGKAYVVASFASIGGQIDTGKLYFAFLIKTGILQMRKKDQIAVQEWELDFSLCILGSASKS